MALKLFWKVTTYSSIGFAGWLVGVSSTKRACDEALEETFLTLQTKVLGIKNIARVPGLPLFGTVSAASPIEKKTTVVDSGNVPATVTPKVARISEIMKYGFPGLINVRSYENYVLSYDTRNRVPHWVFEHITKESVKRNDAVDRSRCEFVEDPSIHAYFRSQNADYLRSGYDRGHMAAAGNHKTDQKHIEETFYLSNIAPQVGKGFNRDAWNKLEKYARKLTKTYANVYICTGPLYLPRKEADGKTYIKYQVIGQNTVAVPTHFFKIIVGETADQHLDMEAYVMPNQIIDENTPLSVFQVPPHSIERASGLLFFDRISKDKLRQINGHSTSWF